MKRAKIILNSTAVNRYDIVFPASALLSCMRQSLPLGLPSFLSHDHHHLLGWMRPTSLYVKPGLGLLCGEILLPEGTSDEEELSRAYHYILRKRISEEAGPHEKTLKEKLSPHLTGEEVLGFLEGAALQGPGLARRRFPEIFAEEDKEGLIPIKALSPLGPGVFDCGDGLVLFAHSFFRRALSRLNTLNEPFLARFQRLSEERAFEGTARIALDADLVGLKATVNQTIELEYWWGPKFNEDLSKIDFGVTYHEASERTRLFHGISRTEFGWYEQGGNPTFECEEVRDKETLGVGKEKFGCRFVHSIVDAGKKQPFHLDGAIRMYTEESMLARTEVDFKRAGRHTEYTKLWRLDGEIPVSLWKELITHYFRDNHLVGEYFGAKEEIAESLKTVAVTNKDTLQTFVPCDLQPEDGIRISISIHENGSNLSELELISFDSLSDGEKHIDYIEADTIELVKIAKRLGFSLAIPREYTRIAYEDLVLNLPLIVHRGPNAFQNAHKTLAAVKLLCESWSSKQRDKLISFSIGLAFPDHEFRVSFAGHVKAFERVFEAEEPLLPIDEVGVSAWTDRVLASLSTLDFVGTPEEPGLWRLLQSGTGILRFSRRILKPEEFDIDTETGDVLVVQEVGEALQEHKLSLAKIFIIERSRCSAGHGEYSGCDCIKSLDEGVGQIIEKASLLGFFITNRRA